MTQTQTCTQIHNSHGRLNASITASLRYLFYLSCTELRICTDNFQWNHIYVYFILRIVYSSVELCMNLYLLSALVADKGSKMYHFRHQQVVMHTRSTAKIVL